MKQTKKSRNSDGLYTYFKYSLIHQLFLLYIVGTFFVNLFYYIKRNFTVTGRYIWTSLHNAQILMIPLKKNWSPMIQSLSLSPQ